MRQLPLRLRWPAQQRFETYTVGENEASVASIRHAATTAAAPWVFVSGSAGSGKTHLLIAACAAASEAKVSAQYLTLTNLHDQPASAIRAFGGSALLCIDDVDALVRQPEAEHALFDLYNRCRAEQSTLIFSAKGAPTQIGLALPDLISRLASCTQVQLKPLTDSERRAALSQRANARGLALDDAVLDYLLTRYARDLGTLTGLLERLDRESLAAKRRITVPFLRQMLEQ